MKFQTFNNVLMNRFMRRGTVSRISFVHAHITVIPFDHFINNDLEYLKGGSFSQKYTTSLTKTKAADYGHVKWIEDKVPRSKVTNLNLDERFALNVALRIYTRRIVIQECVEDLQLAVESYQKKINLSRPDSYSSNLRKMTPYTAYHDIQGIIYQDDIDKNRLMRTDELHKFSDGTLNHVRTALNNIATGIQMEYLPKRKWSKRDKQRARVMINVIGKKCSFFEYLHYDLPEDVVSIIFGIILELQHDDCLV
ncbi:hypothetical protein Tco_1382729 [Tanacetum coccineum]